MNAWDAREAACGEIRCKRSGPSDARSNGQEESRRRGHNNSTARSPHQIMWGMGLSNRLLSICCRSVFFILWHGTLFSIRTWSISRTPHVCLCLCSVLIFFILFYIFSIHNNNLYLYLYLPNIIYIYIENNFPIYIKSIYIILHIKSQNFYLFSEYSLS